MKQIDNTPIEDLNIDWGNPDGTGKKAKSLEQVQAFLKKKLNEGYKFISTATPTTAPVTLTGDEKVFYIATEGGDYTNFGLGNINELSVIKSDNGSWNVEGLGVRQYTIIINNGLKSDFSICDEYGNVLICFKNGHIKTKNFDSENQQLDVDNPTKFTDLNIADEEGNVILKLSGGNLQVKNFDSKNAILDVEFPTFIGKTIGSDSVSLVSSQTELVSPLIRVAKGDIVHVKDKTKINGIKVYEYMYDGSSSALTYTTEFTTDSYTIENDSTSFIRIVGKPSDDDPLFIDGCIYGNSAFIDNVCVMHVKHRKFKDNRYIVGSTIPSGWYVSKSTEFNTSGDGSEVPSDQWTSTGKALLLSEIYAQLTELSSDYSDYFHLELLGYDSSYGKPPINSCSDFDNFKDANGNLKLPVYKFELYPLPVNSDKSENRGYNNSTLPTIYMQFGVHAGEKPIIRAMLNFFIHLCRDWRTDPFLSYIRWNVRIVGIPVLVPYGYIDDSSTPTVNGRCNYNGVNINRNYYAGGAWDLFDSGDYAGNNKGESPISEAETQFSYRVALENADAIAFYDFHTHGVFNAIDQIVTFASVYHESDIIKSVALEIIKNMTVSGWINHDLPTDIYDGSNYIGKYQHSSIDWSGGCFDIMGNTDIKVPTAAPEGLYQYYHNGSSAIVYNKYTDCMNEELVANLILCTLRNYLSTNY